MVRLDRRIRGVAACLSAIAGFVDSVGFLQLRGIFVSFMSGNSTQMAVATSSADWTAATLPGGLILLFLVGVIAGSLVGRTSGRWRRSRVLLFVAFLLVLAALASALAWPLAAIVAAALAMGAENAIFEHDGDVIAVTYMTGTLVKLGQGLAGRVHGDARPWRPYVVSWAALVCGAVTGAWAYRRFGLEALTIPAIIASGLTMIMFDLDKRTPA